MKEVIVFGIILITILIIGEVYLKRKFNINRKKQKKSLSHKRIEFVGILVIALIFFVATMKLIPKYGGLTTVVTMSPLFILTALFRGMMQWIYASAAKVWILEVFGAIILGAIYIVLLVYSGLLSS